MQAGDQRKSRRDEIAALHTWDEAQLDWMRHLLRLTQDRVHKPVLLSVLEVKQLKWEMKAQQQVLYKIDAGHPLTEALLPVAAYMRQYADLHIDWYAGGISGAALRQTLVAAKAWMVDELHALKQAEKKAEG